MTTAASSTITTNRTITVELGRLAPAARQPTANEIRGQILYLPDSGYLVIPEHRLQTGWGCLVVASAPGRPPARRIVVPAAVIAAARTSVTVTPAEPELYAAVWETLVYTSSPGGYLATIARQMATTLRTPGTLTTAVDAIAERRLQTETGLRRTTLQRLLERLAANRFLHVAAPADTGSLGTYYLTIAPTDEHEGVVP